MPRRGTCSLIISTYNAETALDLVLRSVAAQTVLPDEVLIADDGSGPRTAELIARHAARFPMPLRHVWHEDRGFRLTAIRNRALSVAEGAYVLALDGDMVLHPDFVAAHLGFARPGWYVQGGRVMLREPVTRRILAGEPLRVRPWTRAIGNRLNAIHSPLLARLYRGPASLRRTRGGNMGYWREDARRINGYNEDCVGWGAEDIEFAARLQNAGVRRRNLKFAGIAYHLHHATRPASSEPSNLQLVERAVCEGLIRCANGIEKSAAASPVAMHGALPRQGALHG